MMDPTPIEEEQDAEAVLSPEQCRSLRAAKAPKGMRAAILQKVDARRTSNSRRRPAWPQLLAASVLGFLTFLGGISLIESRPEAAPASSSNPDSSHHLATMAFLLGDSEHYVREMDFGQPAEAQLAAHYHSSRR